MVAQVWERGQAQDLPLSSIVVMAPPTEDSNTQGSTRGKSVRRRHHKSGWWRRAYPECGHFRFFTPLRCVQNDSGGCCVQNDSGVAAFRMTVGGCCVQNHYGLVEATSRGMKSAVSYVKAQGGFQTRPYDTTRRHCLFSEE